MTEKDASTPAPTDNSSAKAAPKSNFAKAAAGESGGRKGTKPAKNRRGRGWLWLLLFVILAGGAGTWAWYKWPPLREQLAGRLDFLPFLRGSDGATGAQSEPRPAPGTPSRPEADNGQPGLATDRENSPSDAPTESAEEIAALRSQLDRQNSTITQLQQQLARLQRDVTAQGNRLGELGNASRDDWQLAEADYLLRLANQRLLMERDSRAALGLLEEVDNILRDVELPDLYGVRQQLARDITALKLVENIDREGLYLRLRALEEQLLRVSIQPQFDLVTPDPDTAERGPTETDTPPDTTEETSAWRRSWHKFTRFMGDSVRIRDGEIDPVLLSPQSEARFRQSLRLNMEQAQLALLREDTTVYKDALNRARELLLQYGATSKQREVLARELETVREKPIETELPSLAASQSALHDYIERLHKTSVSGGAPSGADTSDTDASDTPAPGGDEQ